MEHWSMSAHRWGEKKYRKVGKERNYGSLGKDKSWWALQLLISIWCVLRSEKHRFLCGQWDWTEPSTTLPRNLEQQAWMSARESFEMGLILHMEFSDLKGWLASGLWARNKDTGFGHPPGVCQTVHWANIKMEARIRVIRSTSRAGIEVRGMVWDHVS